MFFPIERLETRLQRDVEVIQIDRLGGSEIQYNRVFAYAIFYMSFITTTQTSPFLQSHYHSQDKYTVGQRF